MGLDKRLYLNENEKYLNSDIEGTKSADFFNGKSDSEIWELFKAGHEGAFFYIYNTYLDDLFRYGSHITNNRELIKDAIHDLFVELRRSRNLSRTDSIKYYLLKALRWKLLRLIKRSNKKNKLCLNNEFFNAEAEISIEAKIINKQITDDQLMKLNKAIKKLNKKQIEALYHFYYEDMSYSQLASIMGFSNIKSARNLIYKSIEKLKVYFLSK